MVKKHHIYLALIAMIFMGVADFLLKTAIGAGLHIYVLIFYVYLTGGIIFGLVCLGKRSPLKITKNLLKYSLLIGGLFFIATLFTLAALKSGDASVVIPVVRMQFVFTTLLAFVFLREKVTLQKGLGILFAAISLVLLSQ